LGVHTVSVDRVVGVWRDDPGAKTVKRHRLNRFERWAFPPSY
jgi:hypothetical protein